MLARFTASAAEVRTTSTGAAIATIRPPKPYATWIGVTGAADDRTFVLAAQERHVALSKQRVLWLADHDPGQLARDESPAARFFVLHIDPASRTASGLAQLVELPISYVPDGLEVSAMALSPDGTSLAAIIGDNVDIESRLYVFDLATGTQRSWGSLAGGLHPSCDCPGSIGPGFGGVNVGTLSWTADGRTISLIWGGNGAGVWLLDTADPRTNLLKDSRLAVATPEGPGPYWRTAIVTPDGRTIVAVRQLRDPQPTGSQELVTFSAATGKVALIIDHVTDARPDQQVLWASSSGSELVITGYRLGASAGVLRGRQYTPIPWSAGILTAAW